ncbi:hypothetical protein PSTG_08992 [Puccinia striiformis f. sp. tritici PST-78]|uniref:Uncharacterized protein n=1 Tax=Puccinia striiformis f. sp. tritici PST-78 TaxID=1165861 RepID=A0A0L0VER4_9BASI|nr:hypothetical protein PSTG_08992 [Puccinia striiformis f. sp. tritici PST-78]
MTSIGTGYDLSASTYRTVIGLECKDGVILAVEKLVQSKLLVPGSNKRLRTVDLHVRLATAG